MNKREFLDLRIGDEVVVTTHGRNKGKRGIVADIIRQYGGGKVYLVCVDDEFIFSESVSCRRKNDSGWTSFKHEQIAFSDKKKLDRIFYIEQMFGEGGISWPADNFTFSELKVIERFLKELNPKIEAKSVDCISILDNEGEE